MAILTSRPAWPSTKFSPGIRASSAQRWISCNLSALPSPAIYDFRKCLTHTPANPLMAVACFFMTSPTEAMCQQGGFAAGSSQPVFFAVCAFSAAIVIGTYTWRPASWWLVAVLVFLLSATLLWARRPLASALLASLSLVVLGKLH